MTEDSLIRSMSSSCTKLSIRGHHSVRGGRGEKSSGGGGVGVVEEEEGEEEGEVEEEEEGEGEEGEEEGEEEEIEEEVEEEEEEDFSPSGFGNPTKMAPNFLLSSSVVNG